MKVLKMSLVIMVLFIVSCSSVSVVTDYDTKDNFERYKTFAFYKAGLDKVQVSDLDKKRVLRAITEEMKLKGFTLSDKPDILVNINMKSKKNVDVYRGGFGWGPFYGPVNRNVVTSIDGVLLIDFINARNKKLIWSGSGEGHLAHSPKRKDKRVAKFVSRILKKYPPNMEN